MCEFLLSHGADPNNEHQYVACPAFEILLTLLAQDLNHLVGAVQSFRDIHVGRN